MTYQCDVCGEHFDETEIQNTSASDWKVCPECGDDEIRPVYDDAEPQA
jgi:putative FmdB family regulatory protein